MGNHSPLTLKILFELSPGQLLCTNARGTSDRFFKNPVCQHSLMILKLVPTALSDWHLVMVSIGEQLFPIICLFMNSIQVLPFQLFYECAPEMARCQRGTTWWFETTPRHKKKESLTECNVYNLGCFVHPLQLCIHDAIFKQKSVQEWITVGDGSLAVILRIWLQWLPRFSIQDEPCLSYNQLEGGYDYVLEFNPFTYFKASSKFSKPSLFFFIEGITVTLCLLS